MKNFYETFCRFSFPRSQGLKWQMIKQDWRKIEAADEQTTTDSSVGRAEDCRKTDILRSQVRVRVGGWHQLLFNNDCRKFLYCSKLKLCQKI